MSFSICNSSIVLCTGDHILIYNLKTNTENVITLPKLESEKQIKAHNREDIESFHTLISVDFSKDGQYFLVCANRKQLCLFKTENFEIVSNRTIPRAASSVRFTPSNDIIVADKSGDAYLFSTSQPDENGQLLLGHLSMLLDVLVSDDQKYVITADRDEKVRISMFPHSYDILSYCLGHKNFVTNVAIVPHDKDILVSSGGDGALIFWDFKNGKELTTVYFHEKLSQNDLVKLNKTLKDNDLDENVTVSPVKHLKLLNVNAEKTIVLLTFYCSNVVLVYSVFNGKNNLKVEYLEEITIEKEPLECQCYHDQFWVLTDSKIHIYKYNGSSFVFDENLNNKIKILNESWKKIHNISNKTLLPVLYKRKFDTVQEYQERKKSRLIK